MHLRTPKDWEIREAAVTAESSYRRRSRREFLKTLGTAAAGAFLLPSRGFAAMEAELKEPKYGEYYLCQWVNAIPFWHVCDPSLFIAAL